MLSSFNYGFSPSMFLWEKDSSVDTESSDVEQYTADLSSMKDPSDAGGQYKSFSMYRFDAVPSEGHSVQSTVTKFPMSNGFIISDHMIKQNRILKLKVVSSNMVNNEFWEATIPGAITAAGDVLSMPILGLIGNAVSLVQTAFESQDRVRNAYKLFNELMSKGTRLYVNTIIGAYSNCIVTGIEVIQDKDTSSILAAEITIEEMQVVSESSQSKTVRTVLENEVDYSKFIKMGTSVGLFAIGQVV